jgi:1A family penicillin-binding protein
MVLLKNHMSTQKKHTHRIKNILFLILGAGIIGFSGIIIWISTLQIPDFKSFEDRKIESSTKIYDRTGEILLYDANTSIKRTVITPDLMGTTIKNATIAIEDAEFYSHKGVRPTSVIRAIIANLTPGGVTQGGSTITQQVVKNSVLTKDKTIARKLKEWVLSFKLEQSMSKEDILAMYLNEAPYGGAIYGVQEASQSYFGKNPIDITIAEAAYLAALPQSPTVLSPYKKNRERLDTRKNLVLSRMKELGFITQEEYDKAVVEVVTFKPQQTTGIKAPHFVFFLTEALEEKYGEDLITTGGLKIISTLDYTLQQKAEEIVKKYAFENEKAYKAKNAGLVAIDPKTGQILTMVGSRDYFDKEIDGNFNITTGYRQPGSSFKPFVYVTAFEQGYQPETALFDVPTEFSGSCNAYGQPIRGPKSNCYMPDNFDNKYKGPISLRSALGESRNIPAVKLLYLVGIDNALKTARDLGITSLKDAAEYGLTLVLGGGEVRLLDMASAYATFATNGTHRPYSGILSIEDEKGTVLETYQDRPQQVLDRQAVLKLSSILSDNNARIPTFGANSVLYFGNRQVAAKTGTTNNNKDAWVMGYTPSIVVGVWAGNNENTPMIKSSAAIAGPLWRAFMNEILKTVPVERFEEPEVYTGTAGAPMIRGLWQGGEGFVIDTISQKLATELTPEETRQEKVITNVHSILHWVQKNNPLGPLQDNPQSDPQYERWEIAVQNWWAQNKGAYNTTSALEKPTLYDDVHTEANKPNITILSPSGTISSSNTTPITVIVSTQGVYPIQRVDYYLDDQLIGSIKNAPWNISFTPSEYSTETTHNLKAVIVDSVFNKNETEVTFSTIQ